jgi:hypothetical protein
MAWWAAHHAPVIPEAAKRAIRDPVTDAVPTPDPGPQIPALRFAAAGMTPLTSPQFSEAQKRWMRRQASSHIASEMA